MLFEMKLPNLGDGISEAELVKWLVAPGQQVRANQRVALVSTPGATLSIEAERDGTIAALSVKAGEKVRVGQALYSWRGADGAARVYEAQSSGAPSQPEHTMADFGGTSGPTPAASSSAFSKNPPRPVDQTISDVGQPGQHKGAGAGGGKVDGTIADVRMDSASDAGPGGAGSLEILTVIGEGGMAIVYLARDTRRNKFVAIKRILDKFVDDPKAVSRFRAEADAMRRLEHDHIVRAFDSGSDASGPYIVMEFVEGPVRPPIKFPRGWEDTWPSPSMSLEEYVNANGKLSLKQTVTLGEKLCLALTRAHGGAVPMYHRDIHPHNVLLYRTVDHPKLVDFGLVKERDSKETSATMVGVGIGRHGYLAPEQERDASIADHRSDIYALARTLWFAATGDRPQDFLQSKIDEALRLVLLRASDTTRERRYQSAVEFSAALGKCLSQAHTAPTSKSKADSWECGTCKRVNPDGARFCEVCANDSMASCENCKKQTRAALPICRNCGVHRGRFVENARLLDLAEAAGKARHFNAAVAIFLKIAEDPQAETTQKAQAKEALRQYQPAATRVASDLASLATTLESGVFSPLPPIIASLRPKVSLPITVATWPIDVRDSGAQTRFEQLWNLARQALADAAQRGRNGRRLDVWADASGAARSAFQGESWTQDELFHGVEARAQLHARLLALDTRVDRGGIDLPADYDKIADELRDLATWTGHVDQGKLDRGVADVESKRLRCNVLYAKWKSGRARLGELVLLRALLPKNEEIRQLVAKKQQTRQAAKNRRVEVRAAVRRLRAKAVWPIARWTGAWMAIALLIASFTVTTDKPDDVMSRRIMLAVVGAIVANRIAREIYKNAGRLLLVQEVGFRWVMGLAVGGLLLWTQQEKVNRTLQISSFESFAIAIGIVLVVTGLRAKFSPVKLALWGVVPVFAAELAAVGVRVITQTLDLAFRGGRFISAPNTKDTEMYKFYAYLFGGAIIGVVFARCLVLALEAGMRSSIRFGSLVRHLVRFIVLACVSYLFIGTTMEGKAVNVAGGAMVLGATIFFFRSQAPHVKRGYRSWMPHIPKMESVAPIAAGIVAAMVLLGIATYICMRVASMRGNVLTLEKAGLDSTVAILLIIGATAPLAALSGMLRGTTGRRVLGVIAIPIGLLLTIIIARQLGGSTVSKLIGADTKYAASNDPNTSAANLLEQERRNWIEKHGWLLDPSRWVMSHRAQDIPSLWGGLAAASILCMRPRQSGRSKG